MDQLISHDWETNHRVCVSHSQKKAQQNWTNLSPPWPEEGWGQEASSTTTGMQCLAPCHHERIEVTRDASSLSLNFPCSFCNVRGSCRATFAVQHEKVTAF